MTVRHTWILFTPLLVAGCTTQGFVTAPKPQAATPMPAAVAAVSPTKIVETRYEVRGYREPANSDVRHEAHAVYRRTRVPVSASDELATVPRKSFASASYAPLPASEELSVELATQRAITSDVRAMQASMAEIERQMQAQYAQLLRQSAEVMKAREQLEAERRRAPVTSPAETTTVAPTGAKSDGAEVKW